MATEHGCAITGWASALPSTVVTNQDIMTLFDTSDEWIVERTGIRQRRAADGPFVTPKPSASPPTVWGRPPSWRPRLGGAPWPGRV